MAADCLAAPRRNFEADGAAPWQHAPPLDYVQVAAVRAAWHESWPPPRRPRSMLVLLYGYQISSVRKFKKCLHSHINTQTVFKIPDGLIGVRACLRLGDLHYSSFVAPDQSSTAAQVHGPTMDSPWTLYGPPWTLHGPPWTLHGHAMDSPWTLHGLSMDSPWTTMDSPWTLHRLFMDYHGLPWTTTDCS